MTRHKPRIVLPPSPSSHPFHSGAPVVVVFGIIAKAKALLRGVAFFRAHINTSDHTMYQLQSIMVFLSVSQIKF